MLPRRCLDLLLIGLEPRGDVVDAALVGLLLLEDLLLELLAELLVLVAELGVGLVDELVARGEHCVLG